MPHPPPTAEDIGKLDGKFPATYAVLCIELVRKHVAIPTDVSGLTECFSLAQKAVRDHVDVPFHKRKLDPYREPDPIDNEAALVDRICSLALGNYRRRADYKIIEATRNAIDCVRMTVREEREYLATTVAQVAETVWKELKEKPDDCVWVRSVFLFLKFAQADGGNGLTTDRWKEYEDFIKKGVPFPEPKEPSIPDTR